MARSEKQKSKFLVRRSQDIHFRALFSKLRLKGLEIKNGKYCPLMSPTFAATRMPPKLRHRPGSRDPHSGLLKCSSTVIGASFGQEVGEKSQILHSTSRLQGAHYGCRMWHPLDVFHLAKSEPNCTTGDSNLVLARASREHLRNPRLNKLPTYRISFEFYSQQQPKWTQGIPLGVHAQSTP
jgi:hypothetical protein